MEVPELSFFLILSKGYVTREQDVQDVQVLPAWLTFAQASSVPELRQFAQGIERDHAAVEAALSRPESNGPVEGLITKLKFIKRSMYGRGSFALLRLRLLQAA